MGLTIVTRIVSNLSDQSDYHNHLNLIMESKIPQKNSSIIICNMVTLTVLLLPLMYCYIKWKTSNNVELIVGLIN